MPSVFGPSTKKPFSKKAATSSRMLDRLVRGAMVSGNPAYMASVLSAARQKNRGALR